MNEKQTFPLSSAGGNGVTVSIDGTPLVPKFIWVDGKGNYVPEIGSMTIGNYRRYMLCE